jgi:hypothetical protein
MKTYTYLRKQVITARKFRTRIADMNLYNKKNIFSIIFLLYFIVFVISPLYCSYSAKRIAYLISPDNASCAKDNINISFGEPVCYKVSRKDISHSNATVTILLIKSRAVLPEDANARITHFEDISVTEGCAVPGEYPLGKLEILFDGQDPLQDHRPLQSGPSPPSA